jgi:hypothetical protein
MGFGNSDQRIYNKIQVKGKMLEIANRDVVTKLKPFEQQGFKWKNGSLVRPISGFESFDTPWCHAGHLAGKHCGLDHQLTFNLYNIIHPRCMSCWKSCMGIKNFDELMTWYKVQNNEMGIAAKCGIEMRDYTPKLYGSYHYAHSLDEGREQYEMIHRLAKKYLSEETAAGLILKRACTEYEMEKGNSAAWFLSEKEEKMLDLIDTYVDSPVANQGQNKTLAHPHVQLRWLRWAHMNNDFTYLPYNDDTKLFPGYLTYHEGDVQELKHDMALLQAEAKHNIPPEITHEFLKGTTDFASEYDISLEKLGPALGYDRKSPYGTLNFKAFIEEVDPDVIGEGDNEPVVEEGTDT